LSAVDGYRENEVSWYTFQLKLDSYYYNNNHFTAVLILSGTA